MAPGRCWSRTSAEPAAASPWQRPWGRHSHPPSAGCFSPRSGPSAVVGRPLSRRRARAPWSRSCESSDSDGRRHAAGSAGSGFPRRTSLSASSHVQSRRRIPRSRSSTSPPACGASPWTSRRCPLHAGLLRADLAEDRPLVALAVIELRERRLPVRVASRPLGLVASRRALAGLEVGGGSARRVSRLARGLAGPHHGARRAARPGASADDRRGVRGPLRGRGARHARRRSDRGVARPARGGPRGPVRGALPSRRLSAPLRPRPPPERRPQPEPSGQGRVPRPSRDGRPAGGAPKWRRSRGSAGLLPGSRLVRPGARPGRGDRIGRPERPARSARPSPRSAASRGDCPSRRTPWRRPPRRRPAGLPSMAGGGGYSGPLAYRQGKPMRPTWRRRSTGSLPRRRTRESPWSSTPPTDPTPSRPELFAQHPDPRWVAPPGKSLHRCATELDLGPPTAYSWLAAHAPRFGFVEAVLLGGMAFRLLAGPPPVLHGRERHRSVPDGGLGRRGPAGLRARPGFATRSFARRRAGTSPPGCSPPS